jgi:hypothetical protein
LNIQGVLRHGKGLKGMKEQRWKKSKPEAKAAKNRTWKKSKPEAEATKNRTVQF